MFDVMYNSEEIVNKEAKEGDCFEAYVGGLVCFKMRVGLADE